MRHIRMHKAALRGTHCSTGTLCRKKTKDGEIL